MVGIATFDGTPVERASIEAMASAAEHRGADGLDIVELNGAAFGYQRRRVLAAGADEKGLVEADGLLCIADARLDNRQELLTALGTQHSVCEEASEAEIILAAYREWGLGCAIRLIGDFAFVIWDSSRRRLYAARDPMAMRSLSYHVRPGRMVAVATEVKQLLTLPWVPVRLYEPAVMADLIADFGRPEWTFYEGIANVAPGEFLLVDGNGVRTERFWSPDAAHRLWFQHRSEYAEHLRTTFMEAVAARLRTSSPAGVLLSGGVDSTSVASAAGWLVERGAVPAPSIHAFCWAFGRLPQCDERAVSSLVTNHYQMQQTDVPADMAGPLADFPAHGPDRDDPYLGAFQPLIERSLAAARSSGVGVMLGGDRGDLLIGPTGLSYLRLARARRWRDLREELGEHRLATSDPWRLILRRHFVDPLTERLRRRSALEWLRWSANRAATRTPHSTMPEWLRVTTGLSAAAEAAKGRVADRGGFGVARGIRRDWIFTQLHIRGMAWSERTYARFGLGFADPFSDRRLVEVVLAMPQAVINRPGDHRKLLMRSAMDGIMPNEARRRASKIVPTPLYEQALREDAHETVRELLTHPRVAREGWVDADLWSAHYDAWRSGNGSLRAEWWWTLGIEIWLRRYW